MPDGPKGNFLPTFIARYQENLPVSMPLIGSRPALKLAPDSSFAVIQPKAQMASCLQIAIVGQKYAGTILLGLLHPPPVQDTPPVHVGRMPRVRESRGRHAYLGSI